MPKFLSFLKNKKTLFAFLLFTFIFGAVSIPNIAHATVSLLDPSSWTLTNILDTFANGLLALGLFIPLFVIAFCADVSGAILGLVIILNRNISFTQSLGVNIGWPIVRDLANMMIVLGFVVIGIATAVRFNEYEAKKLLAPLIIAALLVNFSLLICGVVIDGSNIMTNFLFMGVSGSGIFAQNMANVASFLWNNTQTLNPAQYVFLATSMIIFSFIAFFIYLLYSLVLLSRIIALWVLVIFSPLAFVCYVFPATKSIWQMWWKNFFQWCIIGIPIGLFYYIGATMIQKITSGSADKSVTSIVMALYATPGDSFMEKLFNGGGIFVQQMTSNFSIMIPALFLIIGFFVSLQIAPMGASSIMSWANSNKGKAMGMGRGVLGKVHSLTTGRALNATSNKLNQYSQARGGGVIGTAQKWAGYALGGLANPSASSQRTKQLALGLAEWAGAIPTGEAGAEEAEAMGKEQKNMTALISQGRLAEVQQISEGKGLGVSSQSRGAAVGALLKSGNFDLDNDKQKAGLDDFQKRGGDLSEYSSKDPRLSGYSISARRKTMKEINPDTITATSLGRNYTEAEADQKNIASAYAKIGPRNVDSISGGAIDKNFFRYVRTKTIEKAADLGNFTDKQEGLLEKHITPGTKENKELQALRTQLGSSTDPKDIEDLKRINENIFVAEGIKSGGSNSN